MTDDPAEPPAPEEIRRAANRAAAKRIDRVNGWLHLGGALPANEYQRFREAGISHVVDLREEEDPEAQRLQTLGIVRRRVPVPNGGPPTVEQLVEVAKWIDETNNGATLYVHCQGGFGRAATMAVGLLVVYGAPLDEAIEKVRVARPEMKLNDKQLAWLRTVEQEFKKTNLKGLRGCNHRD